MAECLLLTAAIPAAVRGGGGKRDDEIEAGRNLTGLKKGNERLVRGIVYGRTDDGGQMRQDFETLVGDGLGIGS